MSVGMPMSEEFTCLQFVRRAGETAGADVLEVVIDRPDSRLNAVDGRLHEELTRDKRTPRFEGR
jgi:hypothetical protein